MFEEFETLYTRLQDLKAEGEGDSFQADALRLRLDALYDEMSDDERRRVRELTGGADAAAPDVEPDEAVVDSDATEDAGQDEEPAVAKDEIEELAVPGADTAPPVNREPKRSPREDRPKQGGKHERSERKERAPRTVRLKKEDEPTGGANDSAPQHSTSEPAGSATPPVSGTASATAAADSSIEPATHAPLPKPAEIFDRSVTFTSLGLKPDLLKSIHAMGFEYPTDIQAKLIPPALAGKDLIGQARTGTGKTAAFGMPVLHQADPDTPMQALILVPTRELAAQVAAEMEDLGKYTPIRTTCIIGGESMRDQARSISKGGHIVVGTPGRIMDMHQRGEIHFHNIRFIVLDEVDRMLDIGFREDIRKILKSVHTEHQTIFVSATISDEIERLGRSFMKPDAEKIVTISGSLTVSLVDQKYVAVEPWDKRALLLFILRREKPESTVVFCRTKATVDKLAKYLKDHGIDARAMHGDMPQKKRTNVMNSMRQGNLDVLIASDLAARGLDIDHITHVVNYDLPEDPEVYVHRIGRTARVGRRGFAWSFVTADEGQRLTEIEMLCSTIIEKMEYPDFKPGPVPEDVIQRKPRMTHRPESATALLAEKAAERAATPSPVEGLSEAEIKAMFPDGVIPKNLPKSTLGSKFRRRGR